MKILETIFFVLMIGIPSFFIALAIANFKKVKKNRKFKKTLIKVIFLTFIINGIIWGALKMTNNKKETTNDANQKYSENDNQNADNKNDQNNDMNITQEPNQTDTQKTNENGNSSTPQNDKPNTDNNQNSNNNTTTVSSGTTTNGYKIETIDGVTYVDGYMIANKTYPLPSTYVPTGTHKVVGNATNCAECIIEEAYQAYVKMKNDMSAQGMSIWIASGYRSYSYQNGLYTSYVNRNGKAAADTFSARAGHSEHQTGYAFDLNSVSDAFANTKEGIWVNENCYKYGFIIRYPKGKDNETGYKYESWHLRYVGTDLATKLYNGGDWITMETYFGITSQYAS